MKTIKRYLFLFGLIIASSCFAIFLAEVFVRTFYPHARDHVVPGGMFEIDDYLGWKLKAGKSANHHSCYFDVVYTINSRGFRDKPYNVLKDEKIYRILLYGDSQVFGWGVPEDERFSNLIENQNKYLEIWNLAVPGYGLDQQILSYEKGGKLLNADEIVFFVSKATLKRIHHDYIYKKYKPIFVTDEIGVLNLNPIDPKKIAMTSLLYYILKPMYLPYFLERRLGMLNNVLKESTYRKAQESNQENITSHENFGDFEKKILIMARNIALGRNKKITILSNLPKLMRKDLQDFCDQNEIGLLEIVLDKEKEDLVFSRYDHHWNTQAHKLVAGQLLLQLDL